MKKSNWGDTKLMEFNLIVWTKTTTPNVCVQIYKVVMQWKWKCCCCWHFMCVSVRSQIYNCRLLGRSGIEEWKSNQTDRIVVNFAWRQKRAVKWHPLQIKIKKRKENFQIQLNLINCILLHSILHVFTFKSFHFQLRVSYKSLLFTDFRASRLSVWFVGRKWYRVISIWFRFACILSIFVIAISCSFTETVQQRQVDHNSFQIDLID